MSRQKQYYLLWKGAESGPFSAEEIERMLKFGRIGQMHKIRDANGGEYMLLRDFSARAGAAAPPKNPPNWELAEKSMYLLAGLSFISAWFFALYAAAAAALWAAGKTKICIATFPLALLFCACGLAFFRLLLPMLEQ